MPTQTADTASTCDVFVLGGGPGGSTIAALLAERGWNVVIVEKERHPRFHIGESLLPLNMPLLQQLGVYEEIKRISMPKYGAEFNSPEHGPPITFRPCAARARQIADPMAPLPPVTNAVFTAASPVLFVGRTLCGRCYASPKAQTAIADRVSG